jgi:hypothetical protein
MKLESIWCHFLKQFLILTAETPILSRLFSRFREHTWRCIYNR